MAEWIQSGQAVALVAFIAAITLCSVAFPPGVALIAAGDLGAYIEIVAAFVLLISRLRVQQIRSYLMIILRQVPPLAYRLAVVMRAGVRRRHQSVKAKSGSPDEEGRLARA